MPPFQAAFSLPSARASRTHPGAHKVKAKANLLILNHILPECIYHTWILPIKEVNLLTKEVDLLTKEVTLLIKEVT